MRGAVLAVGGGSHRLQRVLGNQTLRVPHPTVTNIICLWRNGQCAHIDAVSVLAPTLVRRSGEATDLRGTHPVMSLRLTAGRCTADVKTRQGAGGGACCTGGAVSTAHRTLRRILPRRGRVMTCSGIRQTGQQGTQHP